MENIPSIKELLPKVWEWLTNTPQGTVFIITFVVLLCIYWILYALCSEIAKHIEKHAEDESK